MSTTQHPTVPEAGTYTIDPAHTEVGFIARHLIGTKVRGRFTDVEGTFTVAEKPEDSTLEATVQAASIHTNQSSGTTTCAPTTSSTSPTTRPSTLKSTGLKPGRRHQLGPDPRPHHPGRHQVGGLRPGVPGRGPVHAGGQDGRRLLRHGEIDRRDFGVSFNHSLLDGSVVVGNKVVIESRSRPAWPSDPGGQPGLRAPRCDGAGSVGTLPRHAHTSGALRDAAATASALSSGEPGRHYVLAVDLGTGGPKVAVLSATGRIAAHAFGRSGST